jgi:hypothetical protein
MEEEVKHDLYVAVACFGVAIFAGGFMVAHIAYQIGVTAGSLACSMGG